MTTPWLLPVPIQPQELFSSWLVRAALTQGCDPLVLTGSVWPNWRAWTRDIDRGVCEDRFRCLAKTSGIPVNQLQMTTLRPTVEAITSHSFDQLAIWPWILTQGQRNRKRLGGLQYCAACLAYDRIPYYRKQWRFAWYVGCPTHRVKLYDRCWQCHFPVQPHRLEAEDQHLAICSNCKQDLRNAPLQHCADPALTFQRTADAVIHAKSGYVNHHFIASTQWFSLSRFYLALVRRAAIRPTDGLATTLLALNVPPHCLIRPETGLQLEMLPIEERETLLLGVAHLLEANTDQFLEMASHYSLSQATFYGASKTLPNAFHPFIASLPDGVMNQKKAKTTHNSNNPRSKQAVQRMFARLQRKLPINRP